jgi:superfamily II DNA helicase RecQ
LAIKLCVFEAITKRVGSMPLQYRFFSVPIPYGPDEEDSLNSFLRDVRLVHVHWEIICQDGRYYWVVSVKYMTGQGGDARKGDYPKRKDYKEALSPDNFTVFAKFREWRKVAAAREAVQLYAVFTNEQIAEMVEKRVTAKNALMGIDGVGKARAAKYG